MLWTRKTKRVPQQAAGVSPVLPVAVDSPKIIDCGEESAATHEDALLEKLHVLAKQGRYRPGEGQVWVIDDDIAVQALLRSLFSREGFSVVTSGSVIDAMQSLPEIGNSTLVVLDFNIPGGSGLDVLRALREQSETPVVMVSNIRRPELVAQAFELGANEFVEKPFDPRSLLVRARRLME